ncbi:hypothetical protein DV738_g4501, partial [Chaetothyriales sp. CBS 135597]
MSNNQSKSSQPVLPGFYFDADRGKYFRIQPNHIAPQDAKYSRQAVTAERNLKSQQRHDADRARGGRVKTAARKRPKLTSPTSSTQPAAVLPRSSYLDSSCAGSVLRRRLGAVRQQQQSSLAIVKHEWARRVEGRTVFLNNLMSDTFAVDRENGGGQLFTLCVPPPPTVTAARQQSGPALTMYPHNLTTFIDECRGRLHRIDVVNNTGGNAIFWLTHQIGPTSVPEHRFIQQGGGARHADMTMGRVGDELHGKKHERMCVEWKGPNVVMTGDRAGRILLSDVRVPAAAVVRARRQMRYGMAFDYDAHLGIVASASTDFYKTHRMALWDFVDLEHRGGIKTLLTASGKDIVAWDM